MKSNNKVAIFCLLFSSISVFNCISCASEQTESDESFVAIHKDAIGTKETLNADMRALMAMAITYLPSEYKYVNVISATREVVAGVKFSLYVNTLVNETAEICALEVLEKPWIVTDTGGKYQVLQYSNCTSDGEEFTLATPIETSTKINPVFQNGQNNNNDPLAGIEDQIIPHAEIQAEPVQAVQTIPQEASPNPDDLRQQIQAALQTLFNSDDNIRNAIAEITASSNSKDVQTRYESILEQLVQSVVKKIFNQSSNINDNFAYEIPIRLDKPAGAIDGAVVYVEKEVMVPSSTEAQQVEEKRERRAIISSDKLREDQVREFFKNECSTDYLDNNDCVKNFVRKGLVGGHSPVTDQETISQVLAYSKQAFAKVATGENENCEHTGIEDVKQQVVAGIKYTGTVTFKCGDSVEKCNLEIWTQSWTNLLKFYWQCPKFEKFSSDRKKRSLLGGHHELDSAEMKDLEQMVVEALNTASDRNPNKNYHFVGIKSATKQVVSGYAYHVEANTKNDDGTEEQCSLKIHIQKWKNSIRDVKVTCSGETFRFHQTPHHGHHHEHRLYISKDDEHMQKLFDRFQTRHKRNYASLEEYQRRFNIFKQNLYKIEQLNRNEEGTAEYGLTQFADMTTAEFKHHTGLVARERHENEVKNPMADILDIDLPKSFDWREKNVVSEVKNQGGCGSCWAFSVVGNIEGQHAIKYGSLEEYSEQELVDCDKTDNGCGGGYMDDAYKAIESIGGLELESDYTYEAHNSQCRFNSSKVHVRVKGAVDLPKNETAIAQFLVQNGPISIGLNANAMQFYRGGVSKPIKFLCSPKSLDHGVLVVGYGVAEYPKFNKILPYWIIKNSWGKRWGEQGYYRLYRGDNRCGVANMATSAVIE